jgi:hypothetical protein
LRNLEYSDKEEIPISIIQTQYVKKHQSVQKGFVPSQLPAKPSCDLISGHDSDNISLGDYLETEMQFMIMIWSDVVEYLVHRTETVDESTESTHEIINVHGIVLVGRDGGGGVKGEDSGEFHY